MKNNEKGIKKYKNKKILDVVEYLNEVSEIIISVRTNKNINFFNLS